uniref:Uncharacterized protein n=1 Tax=Octopus bimaculoides TaxID=37653 RepID=A0A0L8HEU1_OCTBM
MARKDDFVAVFHLSFVQNKLLLKCKCGKFESQMEEIYACRVFPLSVLEMFAGSYVTSQAVFLRIRFVFLNFLACF